VCVDVDECSANSALCGPLATCVNTVGNYMCRCKDGYEPDGDDCVGTAPHYVLRTRVDAP